MNPELCKASAGIFVVIIVMSTIYASLKMNHLHQHEIQVSEYERVSDIAAAYPELKDMIQEAIKTDCRNTPAPCISKTELDEISGMADQLDREKAIKRVIEDSDHNQDSPLSDS